MEKERKTVSCQKHMMHKFSLCFYVYLYKPNKKISPIPYHLISTHLNINFDVSIVIATSGQGDAEVTSTF